jgi:hypothetical protein
MIILTFLHENFNFSYRFLNVSERKLAVVIVEITLNI